MYFCVYILYYFNGWFHNIGQNSSRVQNNIGNEEEKSTQNIPHINSRNDGMEIDGKTFLEMKIFVYFHQLSCSFLAMFCN